ERLQMIGRCTNTALESLRQDQVEVSGVRQPAAIGVNIGVLQTGAVNIVFHGHVNLKIVNGIKTAAQRSDIPFNMVAMCGNEGSGGFQLPVVTNYDSQETPLLTGAVDLLVLGNQCVMPSLIKLANSQDVSVARVALLKDTDDYEAAVAKAHQAFRRRETKSTVIPAVKSEAYTGYTVENSEAVFQNLAEKYAQGQLKGVIYLGGCGTIANIQDAQPVNLANALINAGYLIIAAGCAGIALAKAGMCHPSWNNNLRDVLSPEIPPVLNIGSCHDAGVFLRIAAVLRQNQVPVMAVFPEINHNKVLATAIGLAVAGINTWLGYEPIFADPVLVGWLNEKLKEQAGGHILPLMNATDFLQNLTESANGR
ncbi:MAG TPA: hypothetical protein VN631_10900, partial [Negativicutes bacterium]|nr:hypothetical protein [Negativicutes bacterium]